MPTVYLSIGMGDQSKEEESLATHRLSQDFFARMAPQLGLTGELQNQPEEAVELLTEAFNADPSWRSKGVFSAEKPLSTDAGRLVIDTFPAAPKAVENFICLCTGSKGTSKASGKPLHFRGSPFHRIVTNFVCQGGDIIRGGDSIYAGKFNDEKAGLKLKHSALGTVSYANSGKNSNTSQFFLTLGSAASQCDGKHVVIGQVVEGLDLLDRINAEAASVDGKPRTRVWISDCGVLQ